MIRNELSDQCLLQTFPSGHKGLGVWGISTIYNGAHSVRVCVKQFLCLGVCVWIISLLDEWLAEQEERHKVVAIHPVGGNSSCRGPYAWLPPLRSLPCLLFLFDFFSPPDFLTGRTIAVYVAAVPSFPSSDLYHASLLSDFPSSLTACQGEGPLN